mgnify:CR=1 FL=1
MAKNNTIINLQNLIDKIDFHADSLSDEELEKIVVDEQRILDKIEKGEYKNDKDDIPTEEEIKNHYNKKTTKKLKRIAKIRGLNPNQSRKELIKSIVKDNTN